MAEHNSALAAVVAHLNEAFALWWADVPPGELRQRVEQDLAAIQYGYYTPGDGFYLETNGRHIESSGHRFTLAAVARGIAALRAPEAEARQMTLWEGVA